MFIFKQFQPFSSPDRPKEDPAAIMLTCPIMGSSVRVSDHYLRPGFRKPLRLKAIKDAKRKILFPVVVTGLDGYSR
jgi:hypothetical protein